MDNFNYGKAEADLYDVGCHHSEEIYECRTEKEINSFMRENDLDPSRYYKDNGRSASSSGTGSSEGCFLTTACVRAKGLPDDCEELTVLRAYRDNYLKNRVGGASDIARYYKTAPSIVEAIDRLPQSSEIWKELYETMVLPCVALIKGDRPEETYELYRECALKLEEEYGMPVHRS